MTQKFENPTSLKSSNMYTCRERGVSLIAAVFVIVVLAFMGVVFLSLISTSSFTSVNDLMSSQAQYIAEGGVEYGQYTLAQNLDWYRSTSDSAPPTTQNLGIGSFATTTTLPATKLRRRLRVGDASVQVYTTDRFPTSGYLQIDDDVPPGGGAEFIQYGNKTANTFTIMTRGVDLGVVSTLSATFPRGTAVYPVAQLANPLTNTCGATASITLKVADSSSVKFLSAGTIDILTEEIGYTGMSIAGLNITLTGIQRCLGGPGTSVAGAVNDPVTPVLVGGIVDNQAEVISTGTVGAASRVVKKTVQR